MKRSQMLNLIWEAINELEDAEHILTRIERAGMKPPFSVSAWSQSRASEGYEWEPETEEERGNYGE